MLHYNLLGALSAILSLHIQVIKASNVSTTCFGPIDWEECQDSGSNPIIQCATYKVPLDYAHPNIGSATLALARVQASKAPRIGTLFINPGGPGGSGVSVLMELASAIGILTNGQYDVVALFLKLQLTQLGWDPRGFNQTSPKLTCGFQSLEERTDFFNGTIINDGIEARGNFTDKIELDNFFSTLDQTDEIITKFGQKCLKDNGAFLKYLGTTAVVRDIVSMADCLDGPAKPARTPFHNYDFHFTDYFVSYGSVIGAYLVNMFPERVGRVIIDGIVDPIGWATEPSFIQIPSIIQDADVVLAGFTDLCAQAGPANCSFATDGATGESLLQEIEDIIDVRIDRASVKFITVYDRHKAGLLNLTSFDVRSEIFGTLSDPVTRWDPELVPQLVALKNSLMENGSTNSTVSVKKARTLHRPMEKRSDSIDPRLQESLGAAVIPCLDSIDQDEITTKQVYDEVVKVTQTISPFFGEVSPSTFFFHCHRFPVRAVERFTGPFNAKLANPILIIGNKADPKTPFENARKLVAAFGPSASLLEQDGFGHTSLAENSDCTLGAIAKYLVTGELPSNGTVCPVNQALFPPGNAPAITLGDDSS
ncbi:hypothetical protein M422DRAFT_64360 [Sphaerobolus stellatus SS14]|nr:hypothetical protein M422DRAFT_64360 [Sphaerobolus stellatus SS14]